MNQYVAVTADEAAIPRDGVIKLHGPEAFAGMHKAGRLAA
ncbi:MAG: type I methionyl aminopeptidase, partial [Sphingomonadaceae bacterium]|nr:type I methionyl aminopeptidase [Sphingomonadaceae bacterium]